MSLVPSRSIFRLKSFFIICFVHEGLLRARYLFPFSFNFKNQSEQLWTWMWSQILMAQVLQWEQDEVEGRASLRRKRYVCGEVRVGDSGVWCPRGIREAEPG